MTKLEMIIESIAEIEKHIDDFQKDLDTNGYSKLIHLSWSQACEMKKGLMKQLESELLK